MWHRPLLSAASGSTNNSCDSEQTADENGVMGNQPSVKNLVFVVLGVALGVAGLSAARTMLETESAAAVRPGDSGLPPEFSRRMRLLEEAIRELNQSIALLLEFPALSTRSEPSDASTQGADVAPADGMPATKRVEIRTPPDPRNMDWSTAVSSPLRDALVEYGLTPYDPGVNRILPKAAREMREAKAEEKRLMTDLRERRLPGVNTTSDPRYPEFDKARSEIQQSHKARTDEIVASFREQVRKLVLK